MSVDKEQFKIGTEIEEEHERTVKQIIDDVKNGKIKPLREYYRMIAEDHLVGERHPKYYTFLVGMEKLMEKGGHSPRVKKSLCLILPDLNKAGAKGAGSRGGKVIGYTKSGKPIYESKSGEDAHKLHPAFKKEDHEDARAVLAAKAGGFVHPQRMGVKGADKAYKKWNEQAAHHVVAKYIKAGDK